MNLVCEVMHALSAVPEHLEAQGQVHYKFAQPNQNTRLFTYLSTMARKQLHPYSDIPYVGIDSWL